VPTAFAVGFVGIGGRFLVVPELLFNANIDILKAVGTSLISVETFGVVTAAAYLLEGLVELLISLLYLAGGVAGGYAGAPEPPRLSPEDVAENIRRGVDRRCRLHNG
jgi:uncharacterized membrane protein YfcA